MDLRRQSVDLPPCLDKGENKKGEACQTNLNRRRHSHKDGQPFGSTVNQTVFLMRWHKNFKKKQRDNEFRRMYLKSLSSSLSNSVVVCLKFYIFIMFF